MNLGIIRKSYPERAISDEDREEIRAKGKELFSGRSIHWNKLGVLDYLRSRVSSDYERKVREEFKKYMGERLIKNMNSRPQTYLNNNLSELKQGIRHIDDLSVEDVRELSSMIDEKEVLLAIKHFAEEREKLIANLIERGCLDAEKVRIFDESHPAYKELKSLEQFIEFKGALYEAFDVPVGERL